LRAKTIRRPQRGRWEKTTGSCTYSRDFSISRPLRVSMPPAARVALSARRWRTPERTFWSTSATRGSDGTDVESEDIGGTIHSSPHGRKPGRPRRSPRRPPPRLAPPAAADVDLGEGDRRAGPPTPGGAAADGGGGRQFLLRAAHRRG